MLSNSFIYVSCYEYPCSKAELSFRLIGFTDAESDTIIMRRFEKNNTAIKDSFVFSPANPIRFTRFADTLVMTAYTSAALMQSDYDYQLIFPVAGRIISITEFREEQSYRKKRDHFSSTKEGCVNIVKECKIDGVWSGVSFPNIVYLKK